MPSSSWRTVSPSQIVSYRQCPRRWYNASILGDREPSKGFQLKGDAIHKALEVYMSTGEVMPEVVVKGPEGDQKFQTMEFVQVARPHLPPPATDVEYWAPHKAEQGGLLVEQAGELPTYEGGPGLVQYIDLVLAFGKKVPLVPPIANGVRNHSNSGPIWINKDAGGTGRLVGMEQTPRARAMINDYKTTSDFRYAKTPAEIEQDIQLNANAKWLFAVSDYEEIELRLLYLQTKNVHPKAKPVSAVVTRESVAKIWERDMATVREMQAWAQMRPPTADALPPNTESCDIYGGCFYRSKCGFESSGQKLFSISKGPKGKGAMENGAGVASSQPKAGGLLDRLVASAARANGAAAAAPPVGTVAPVGGAALFGAVAPAPAAPAAPKPKPAAPAPEPKPAAPAPSLPGNLASIFGTAPVASAPAAPPPAAKVDTAPNGGITPPDAPSPVSTPEEIAAANAADKGTEPNEAKPNDMPAPGASTETVAAPAPAEAAPAKKRGRPRKTADVVIAAAESAPVAAAESVVEAPPAPAPPAPEAILAAFGVEKNEAEPAAPVTVPEDAKPDEALARIKEQLTAPDPTFACPLSALFIDCAPDKGWPGAKPVRLSEIMHAFERTAASSAQALDYRLIRYESKGWLATAVRVLMRGLPEAVIVDSDTPGADVFLSVVTPYAKVIFRGTR